jgi:hypothetical protein
VQQTGQPSPVRPGELDPVAVQVSLQDQDLVPERENLGVLDAVTHRQQPQQGQGIGHAEVRQSKQHTRSLRIARHWRARRDSAETISNGGRLLLRMIKWL